MIFKCLSIFLGCLLLTAALSARSNKRPHFTPTADAIINRPTEHSSKHVKTEEILNQNLNEPNGKIGHGYFDPRYGHGGPYLSVRKEASKKYQVESDHAPQKSILHYFQNVELSELPEKLRKVLTQQKLLYDDLSTTNYAKNEAQIRFLNKEIERHKPSDLSTQIGELDLGEKEPSKKLKQMKDEKSRLVKENAKLRKTSNGWTTGQIENAMGVLSLPYNLHRIFSSTGYAGLDESFHKASAKTIKTQIEICNKDMEKHVYDGINKGYFIDADSFAKKGPDGKFIHNEKGDKVYDFQKLIHQNFEQILGTAYKDLNSENSKPHAGHKLPSEDKVKFMSELHKTHKKKFQLTAVYHAKTPKEGYSNLMSLFIDEYKLYLGKDFNLYKDGIRQLLQANKEFGWISDAEVAELEKKHNLPGSDLESSETKLKKPKAWMDMDQNIQAKAVKSTNPIIKYSRGRAKEATSIAPDLICSESSRSKRSVSSKGCIFSTKGTEQNKPKESLNDSNRKDELSKIVLPSDSNTVSIDSKKLNKYLLGLDKIEGSERLKSAVTEYVSRNSHLLTGGSEDLERTKSIVGLENLYNHHEQNKLANNLLQGSQSDISSKALSNHQKIKLSTTKIAAKASKFTSVSSKVGSSYGKIMLAKGAITALRHGDYESLALMGGQIGLDIALEGVTKLGNKIATKVSTKLVSKFGSEVLGKMAGPVGGMADIGINIYSITKSAKILRDPTSSVFDQNDAIADIVADSIDIAITTVTTVLSMVFPELAPLFGTIALVANIVITAIVGIFKGANHVDRLNSQIPLLDYEKTNEYWRFVTGDSTSGYIQDLIDTKTANNIAVNATVQLLIDNPDFIGRVFPSRTMYDPDADCELMERKCGKLIHIIPLPCKDWKHLSYCNGHGGYCNGSYSSRKCEWGDGTGLVVPIGGHVKIEHKCQCGPDPPPQWGFEITDSVIDFRHEQQVYLQRAAPDFVFKDDYQDFSYLCKPSSLYDEGERVSNRGKSTAYLCMGAIAVVRKKHSGLYMLYDLGNGTDRVTLDENELVDNLFLVKDGQKSFSGNAGDDTFVVSGPCTNLAGTLDGKRHRNLGNSLVFNSSCLPNKHITLNLVSGTLIFENTQNVVSIQNIQRIMGRDSGTATVIAHCSTKLITDGAGKDFQSSNSVVIPACSNSFELIVVVNGSNTFIDASMFTNGVVHVIVNADVSFRSNLPSSFGGVLTFKLNTTIGKLISAELIQNTLLAEVQLGFNSGSYSSFKFIHNQNQPSVKRSCEVTKSQENVASILLTDKSNITNHIMLNFDSKKVQSTHHVQGDLSLHATYNGYDFLENVFYLISGHQTVVGGRYEDTFILNGSTFHGSIDGDDGQNSLHLYEDLDELSSFTIDMYSGFLFGKNYIQISNINNVFGRSGTSERVITSCSTKSLHFGGNVTDYIEIPPIYCPKLHIEIFVSGQASITDRKQNGSTIVRAGFESKDPCKETLPINLMVSNLGGGDMTILLNFPIQQLINASLNSLQTERQDNITLFGTHPQIYFQENFGVPSSLVRTDEGGQVAYHDLGNVGLQDIFKERNGSDVVSNVYNLIEGNNWNVYGGQMDDTFFLLNATFFVGSIHGGEGKNNVVIANEIPNVFFINTTTIWTENENITEVVAFTNISEVYGRSGKAERITISCALQHLQLMGGNSLDYDIITIPKINCKNQTTIIANGYTKISSKAEEGTFNIYLQLDSQKDLHFKSDFIITNSTVINYPIQLPIHQLRSYDLVTKEHNNTKLVQLRLDIADNTVYLNHKFDLHDYQSQKPNVNIMFIDETFTSNGNLVINDNTNELNVLHNIQQDFEQAVGYSSSMRRGAVGAKNIFSLHSGKWDVIGGKLDDSFILNHENFTGKIHGMGGINAIILDDSLSSDLMIVNFKDNFIRATNSTIRIDHIQIVGGRKHRQDNVITTCDTKLVMLEGGTSAEQPDIIEFQESFCSPQISFVIDEFTTIKNNATKGNFTYHIKTDKNFNIEYNPVATTNHALKFEIPLEQIAVVALEHFQLKVNFSNFQTHFPLNFTNLPTIQIAQGPELVAELYLEFNQTIECTIATSTSFSGNITAVNGASNTIVVDTASNVDTITGGNQDDTIFLQQAQSISVINGGGGTNRLHLTYKLHQNKRLEVDFVQRKITSLDNLTLLVNDIQKIQLFTGRETEFERVIVGCETEHLRFAEEIVFTKNCGYNVQIEIGKETRVIFQIHTESVYNNTNENQSDNASTKTSAFETSTRSDETTHQMDETTPPTDKTTAQHDETTTQLEETYETADDEIEEEEEDKKLDLLHPSIFYYYFTSVHNFDLEVENFAILQQTRHIFYLNLTLSQLSSLKFCLNHSRLIYTTTEKPNLEISHLVGEIEDFDMFFKHPEFMTAEGFLLRITRYGEIIASIANPEEILELNTVQQDIIPRLSVYASKLNISFILETGSDFIYCGNPAEGNLLTNREIVTSHLVGFNQTTYEILDLNHDVFIYLQSVTNDSFHVIDLSSIIFQIRNMTGLKYIPNIERQDNNLEIRMTNFTDKFKGKVILVNGTLYQKSITIMLNSIAMEILPQQTFRKDNRTKRSSSDFSWVISPKPIIIPEGHLYVLAAEDLEDGVEIKSGTLNGNSTNDYSVDGDTLIITSISTENNQTGAVSSFAIFDYFLPPDSNKITINESFNIQNITDCGFGRTNSVKNIRVNLNNDVAIISSNKQIVSAKTGDPIHTKPYKYVLDREEFKILKDFPDLPRRFEVRVPSKIKTKDRFTVSIVNIFLGSFFCCLIFIGLVAYVYNLRVKPSHFTVKT